jgi:tRNA threonylcarbamoyladenosine biosynthesis protein TsaE
MTFTLDVPDLAATETLGRALGRVLTPGSVIALNGPLGAGKTHLVRAVAEGLDVVNPAAVNSPTFVLIQEYPARLPMFHFDAYRLSGEGEFLALGVDEYFAAGGVCLIEWAEKVAGCLPPDRLEVAIEIVGETARRWVVTARGDRHAEMAGRWHGAGIGKLESPPPGR